MALYKIIQLDTEGSIRAVQNTETNQSIPADPNNSDYRDFLAWQSAGNTPDPME